MPATPINDSPNITSLQSKVVADLCGGNFLIDITPSVWISTGYNNVQGASIQIVNPVGVTIDQYPTSGFDILPPMTSIYSFAIPLIAGVYGYGTYTITVRLTDADGDTYFVTKSVNLCPPDPNNKNRNYGCMNMDIRGNCRTGNVIFILQNPPNYKGTTFTSQVNALTVKYPTASGKDDTSTTLGSFSLLLYEGQYQVSGTVCALYDYGDYVYFKVNYKVKCEKTIKCIIDECCVFAKLEELNLQVTADCTQAQKDETASIIVNALWLLKVADLAGNCGGDPSIFITQLEDLLGCKCTCDCNEGTPIIGTDASGAFLYRGILTQVGTNNPTAEISAFNTVEITWTRVSTGYYLGTITGLPTDLTEANTFVQINSSSFILLSPTSQSFIKAGFVSANSIYVRSNDIAGAAADALLKDIPIELSIL